MITPPQISGSGRAGQGGIESRAGSSSHCQPESDVEGEGTLAAGEGAQRVDLELGQLREVGSEPGEAQQAIQDGWAVGGGQAAEAFQPAACPGLLEQMGGFFEAQRGQGEGDVFQLFGFDAAQAEHHERPELGVLHGADDHVLAGREHALDVDAVDLRMLG